MPVSFWRPFLLAFCLCCAAINAVSLFSGSVEASSALGFQVSRISDPGLVRVDAVDSGGAAARSGLQPGDLIHLRELNPGDRYRLLTGVYPYERIPVVVSRGSSTVHVLYRAGRALAWRWDIWLWCIASFWMLGFAVFIAWRRPDLPEARILCVLLALNPGGAGLQAGSWIGPWPFADVVTAATGYTVTWLWAALLATYASLFGRPLSLARRMLTGFAYASASAVAIYEIIRLVQVWTGVQPWVAQTLAPDWNPWYGAIPWIVSVICALAAISATQGPQRARIVWTTIPLVVLYMSEAMISVVPMLWPSSEHGDALLAAYGLVNVGAFVAPLGMTYALLNRRVLDIGFVLNRVVIFSAVSLVIVGIFVLVEWALGAWLQEAGHTASVAVGAAVALLLGFSIRFVHGRVEHVLDRVFFRKRHEDEGAIRRFAREAAYVTHPSVLIEQAVEMLERHADASFVHFELSDDAGHYGSVSENDPAIVSLRTWHRVLDLHGIETDLKGEYAYPMVARGRLVGALVVGPKRSQEAYAPDESHAIEELAQGVGGALDLLLQSKPVSHDGAVVNELRAMRAAIVDGLATIQAKLERGQSISG